MGKITTELERRLAEQLHNALMFILCEKNGEYGEFADDNGYRLNYEDGGNLSTGGEMSGFGMFDFDFREAEKVLAETDNPLPKYGSSRKFTIDLSDFATREGCERRMAKAGFTRSESGTCWILNK